MKKFTLFLTILALCVCCGTQEDLASLYGAGAKGDGVVDGITPTVLEVLGKDMEISPKNRAFHLKITPYSSLNVDLLLGNGERWVQDRTSPFVIQGLLCHARTTVLFSGSGDFDSTVNPCPHANCDAVIANKFFGADPCASGEVKVVALICDAAGEGCVPAVANHRKNCDSLGYPALSGRRPCSRECVKGTCNDLSW